MTKPPPVAQLTLPGASSPQPVAVVRAPDSPPDAPPTLVALPSERRRPGRPKGARSKTTLAREAALAAAMGEVAFGEVGDSLDLLRRVMRSPAVPLPERMRAALALAGFDAAKLAPIPPPSKENASLARALQDAYERTGMGRAFASVPALSDEERSELAVLLR